MKEGLSKTGSRNRLIAAVIIAVLFIATFYIIRPTDDVSGTITSFRECVDAGYPILDSYPEQCETPDGKRFIRELDEDELPLDVAIHIESKRDLITVASPRPFSTVSSPLTITGEARGYWYFEADFPIRMEDADGNTIGAHFGTARLDPDDPESTWMTEDFVPFEAILHFEEPRTETGTLILEKDNPSGLLEHADELRIPVRFDIVRITTIDLHYYDPERDLDDVGNIICSDAGLVAVQREVPVTRTPIQDAISLLLRGEILSEEVARGITTEFPLEGVELVGANLRDGLLTLEFDDPLNMTSGGSCRTAILWHQIRATATQFDAVNEVRFIPEELFQP